MAWFDLPLWIIVTGGLLPLLLVAVMLLLRHRNARSRTERRVVRQFNGVPILVADSRCYFYGWERHWDLHWRGYGILLLTDERLYFRLWRRNLDLSIPTRRIRDCGIARGSANCLDRRRKVLQVSYRGADDQLRAAAWRVREPELWVRRLQGRCEESSDEG